MRAKIGKFVNWVGPYQIAEYLCFWAKKETDEFGNQQPPDWVHEFGEFLAHGRLKPDGRRDTEHETWLYRLCNWIYSKKNRKIKIKVDPWDHWNADQTIAMLAVPILEDLLLHKHGAAPVADEDVPAGLGLRASEALQQADENDQTDSNFFIRYEWMLGEVIWALRQIADGDWEEQYYSGKIDMKLVPEDNGLLRQVVLDRKDFVVDYEGMQRHSDRINRGLMYFGKYFRSFWS